MGVQAAVLTTETAAAAAAAVAMSNDSLCCSLDVSVVSGFREFVILFVTDCIFTPRALRS